MNKDFLHNNYSHHTKTKIMKTYIWSLPTRIFHWLLVIGMVAAYILSDDEALLNFHSSVGYMVGIVIIFRIIL